MVLNIMHHVSLASIELSILCLMKARLNDFVVSALMRQLVVNSVHKFGLLEFMFVFTLDAAAQILLKLLMFLHMAHVGLQM